MIECVKIEMNIICQFQEFIQMCTPMHVPPCEHMLTHTYTLPSPTTWMRPYTFESDVI